MRDTNPSIPARPASPGRDLPTAPSGRPREATAHSRPEDSKLIVGSNIRLKGEIAACDVLVVEGEVEAAMTSRQLEIARSGVFKGNCEVATAEIHGRFEGDLTARDVLRVQSTGQVKGRIRYGTLEVAGGGQISGDIDTVEAAEAAEAAKSAKPAKPPVDVATQAAPQVAPQVAEAGE